MMLNRREFLKVSAGSVAAVVFLTAWEERARAFSQSPGLKKFIQPLPGLGPTGIPVASPLPDPVYGSGVDYYELVAGQYTQQLHPDLPPTTLWGYADITGGKAPVHRHLGPVIVAQSGRPVRIRLTNQLPPQHILPVDPTLPGAGDGPNRIALHLHGGHVPWVSDGGPFAWFDPSGNTGASFLSDAIAPSLPPAPGQADYFYPNDQSARLMWYHDHAMGITRLNAYAGLASAYVVRDAFEANLVNTYAIPGAIPGTEIPLVLQDKIFVSDTLHDPTWTGGGTGSLWYAHAYETDRWDEDDLAPGAPPADPTCIPEFFGDTMLVNGVVFPYLPVEPRKYRFRVLNACNARFCSLQLFYAQGAGFPASCEPALNKPGPSFVQIGTEGGFLSSAVGPQRLDQVLLAPAERADLIVDFSQIPVGSTLILTNNAPAPFPMGDTVNDYYPGAKKNPTLTQPGYGPNTRTLLQLRVVARGTVTGVTSKDPRPAVPLKLPSISALSLVGATVRNLTLNEDFDDYGRLIQRMGTTERLYAGTFARNYMDAVTEDPAAGSIEVWNLFNLTGDTHPVHFHLANVQIVGRQAFNVKQFNGVPSFNGPMRPPDPNEVGWKETVRVNPGEMTQVILRFDLPSVPFTVPASPRTGGHEYVWHCHILEHEEHDMMRPFVVG